MLLYLHLRLQFDFKQSRRSSIFFLMGNRSTSSTRFSKCRLIQVSPSLSLSKCSLNLAELGQIESSNFFCFFDLLLVSFDFALELINQTLHSLMILSVFIRTEGKFLDTAL